jgi:NADPH-dependent curcumin reductase CurA
MKHDTNRQVRLAARPQGMPRESDLELYAAPIPEALDSQVLVRTLWLSVDPYMRARMTQGASYAPAVEIGEVMIGDVVAEVVESRHPELHVGDYVVGNLGWQEYAASDGEGLRRVYPSLAPVSTALGVLGMPGLTAYFGLLDITEPNAGETVVVSGAAGAVGSLVGQIARIKGCRVVGIAGSDEKVDWLVDELGFDEAFNYKTSKKYRRDLTSRCPDGIDIYFDNVGGEITEAALPLLNRGARISLCGQISQYNLKRPELGPRQWWHLIVKEARAEGFLVFRYADRYGEALEQLAAWIAEGRLIYREDVVEGIENAVSAFLGMLSGDNIGKRLVKVADPGQRP